MQAFQKRLLRAQKALAATLESMVGVYRFSESEHGHQYYRDYQGEFQRFLGQSRANGLETVSNPQLLRALVHHDIVFLGDYHTLRASQESALAVIEGLHQRGRRVTLGLEMFHASSQGVVNRYMSRRIRRDDTFLRRVNYPTTWGFDWANYRPLLAFARRHGMRVLALNSEPDPRNPQPALAQRDKTAAKIIARHCARDDESLLLVLFGDAHLAGAHLPGEVERELAERELQRRVAVVHQNQDGMYWKLRDEAGTLGASTVRMDRGRFVIINASPLIKSQSYLLWEVNSSLLRGKLDAPTRRATTSPEELEEMAALAYTALGDFFDLDAGDFDATVHFGSDVSFAAGLPDAQVVRDAVERLSGFYLPERRTLHFSDLSFETIAEVATFALLDHTRRRAHKSKPARNGNGNAGARHSPIDRFYDRVLRYALGFFASKIVSPERPTMGEAEHREILEDYHREFEKTAAGSLLADGAQQYLRHRRVERAVEKALSGKGREVNSLLSSLHLNEFYDMHPVIEISAMRRIGYALGGRMFETLATLEDPAQVRRAWVEVRALFFDPLSERMAARRRYFDLYRRFVMRDPAGGG